MPSRKPRDPAVHLNLNVRGLKLSATLAINERAIELRGQGKRVYRLGLGQSPFPVPPSVVDQLKANAHQKSYLPVRGLPELRSAVAEYHRRRDGLPCTADDVLIGPGSKELMFLLQLCYYGELVVPAPSWVSYAPQAKIIGRPIRWVQTHAENHWQLLPDDLEALCADDPDRPRIVILNYPSNPTGRTYKIDELKGLAAVARKHRVVLLSDEIYGELHHRGQHISLARFYPEGTIVSNGLSKWCGAGGWRLGTFTFPPSLRWLLDAMAAVASETYTSTSAPIQYAAVRAFEGGAKIVDYLWQARRVLRSLSRRLANRMSEAGVRVAPPQGGFYLFPDFGPLAESLAARGITDSTTLCERLLEQTGVALLPGSDFGRPPDELTARMAYVDFDGARVMAAATQVPREEKLGDEFMFIFCGNMLAAVDQLCYWVKG